MSSLMLLDEGARVAVEWDDGHRSEFHGLWLRDNCGCPQCLHPSGQRLVEVHRLDPSARLVAANAIDGRVEGRFDDGHDAQWPAAWLREHCNCGDEPRAAGTLRLWDAAIQSSLPEFSYEDLRAWLTAVDELGFAILRGGPAAEGTVLDVVSRFGYVRETNYGRLFDVRSVVEPANLAFTSLALGAHTDNPYRDPTPTLQVLHCISSSLEGGDSTLVDGFRVAGDLMRGQFDLLARHLVRFRYADESTELVHDAPVLDVDAAGVLRAVRFNTRSAQPLDLPADVLEPYYAAYHAFARMLDDARYRITFRLAPGDVFIVDNLRVLHGRTGFAGSEGARHLQGAYADRDALRSTLAVLSR